MIQYCCFLAVFSIVYLFLFPTVTVKGNSMFPTYLDGQKLRSRRIIRFEELEKDAVYVFYAPTGRINIKRLKYIINTTEHKEYCFFLGDNQQYSTDSRKYGYVNRKNIIAKVL